MDTDLGPGLREIVKREAPFFTFAIGMALEDKLIDTVAFPKVALVILPFVLVGNLLVELKEWWKKGIGLVVGGDRERVFWNE